MPPRLEDHLGYLLRQVSNHVSQNFARRLAGEDATVAEWVLMRALYDERGLAPSRIAEMMGFTRGAVSKLADRLIERGLVAREADADDGRAQILTLTAKGRRLTPKFAALADENEAECFGGLSPDERRDLRAILEKTIARQALHVSPTD